MYGIKPAIETPKIELKNYLKNLNFLKNIGIVLINDDKI